MKSNKAGKLVLYSLDAKRDQEIQVTIAAYFGSLKK
jgi:hypothetical protein